MALLQPANEKQLRRYLAEKCPMPREGASAREQGQRTSADGDVQAERRCETGGLGVAQEMASKAGASHRPTGDAGRRGQGAAQGSGVLRGGWSGEKGREKEKRVKAARDPPFLMEGDGFGHGQEADAGDDEVDVVVLAKHVKEMRKYFKAYIKSQSKRRAAAAETLQRAIRCHWARLEAVSGMPCE